MLRDEVKSVIARALCDSDGEFDDPNDSIVRDWWIAEAGRALAALAAAGYEIVKIKESTNDSGHEHAEMV